MINYYHCTHFEDYDEHEIIPKMSFEKNSITTMELKLFACYMCEKFTSL